MRDLQSDILKERSGHLRFRKAHCHSAPPVYETPANIRTNLTFLETGIIDLHFAADSSGIHSIFGGFRQMTFATRVRFGRSRSFKMIDFHTNRLSFSLS